MSAEAHSYDLASEVRYGHFHSFYLSPGASPDSIRERTAYCPLNGHEDNDAWVFGDRLED